MWAKCLVVAMEQKSGLGVKLFIDTFQINQLTDAPIFLLEEFCNTVSFFLFFIKNQILIFSYLKPSNCH